MALHVAAGDDHHGSGLPPAPAAGGQADHGAGRHGAVQILLMRALQREFGMGMALVTHAPGAAAEVVDRVAVTYAGQAMEQGRCGTCCAGRRILIRGGCWRP